MFLFDKACSCHCQVALNHRLSYADISSGCLGSFRDALSISSPLTYFHSLYTNTAYGYIFSLFSYILCFVLAAPLIMLRGLFPFIMETLLPTITKC